jgi:hypothetical protein
MGCGRLIRGATVLVAAVLLAVPSAFAATPSQIYRDFDDDGRLDGRYTRAELQTALQNPAVQGYGRRTVERRLRPEIQRKMREAPESLAAVRRSGGLPFTGLDLALLTAGGGFLLALGASMRRLARAKQR